MFRSYHSLALVAALAAPLFATPARAGIEACGNIDVQADATCKAEVGVDCKAHCKGKLDARCHADLQASCEGGCTATLPSCQASCEGSCSGKCTANPGSFDCEANCNGTCEGNCQGKCASNANSTECEGSCKATCSGECTGKCTGTPPSAECSGKCQASCQGSCSAEAHMDCQIDCQAKGMVDCQASVQLDCEAGCDEPEGTLFCDGNYVDKGGNAAACIDALNAFLKNHVDVSATGSANCAKGVCEAQGQASCKCSRIAPTDATNAGAFTMAGLAFAAIAARRRSRRS